MQFYKNWMKQKGPAENIAAILTTFCRFYNLEISRKTIFDNHTGTTHMAHFEEIIHFCEQWNIEHLHLNFVPEHLSQQFLPAFVLMQGYYTQLVMYVEGEKVFFVDAQLGWQEENKTDFLKRSMGHIIIVNPESYSKEAAFTAHEQMDRDKPVIKQWSKPTVTKLEQERNYGKQLLQKKPS